MNSNTKIVAQLEPKIKPAGRLQHFREKRSSALFRQETIQTQIKTRKNSPHSQKQLSLPVESIQKPRVSPQLQIASVPLVERINSKENRYILLVQPQGIRACDGQFTADEAYQIAKLTKRWDWSLDGNNRLYCLAALEQLLDSIIKQSSQGSES